MSGAGAALSHVNAAGFALIGVLAFAAWVRWRGRTRAWLAAALGLLALVTTGGELSARCSVGEIEVIAEYCGGDGIEPVERMAH